MMDESLMLKMQNDQLVEQLRKVEAQKQDAEKKLTDVSVSGQKVNLNAQEKLIEAEKAIEMILTMFMQTLTESKIIST